MKKLLTLLIAGLTGIALLTSCGTSTVVMKRHYMKGYYVAGVKPVTKPVEKIPEVEPVRMERHIYSIPAPDQMQNLPGITYGTQSIARSESIKEIKQAKEAKLAVPVKKTQKLYSLPERKMDRQVFKPAPLASNGDALSLLWIVILVLLILWAIGFIAGGFGLGGLIHVLLVIALVLLILWLLRII